MEYLRKLTKNIYFWLFLILVFSSFLRIYQLGDVPSGFTADEAAFGYNAFSILETGKDEYGKAFPIVLKSFGDFKPALYSYLDIPFVYLFDLNTFSTRLPSAIFGIATVILIYFFSFKLFKDRKIALISSLLLAISPWHLILSRVVSEVVASLFFILLMSYGLLSLNEKYNKRWIFISLISGIFAVLSYTASRFFIVLIAGLFFIHSLKKIKKKISFSKSTIFVILFFMIIGIGYSFIGSIDRFNQVSIFSSPETKLIMEEQIREDQFTPVLITRAFHNKIASYSRTLIDNYAKYLTLDFLVLKGGFPLRVSVYQAGLFYIWQLPFLLMGVYFLIRKKNLTSLLILGWWFLLLIPAAITYDEIPNLYRSLVILPAIIIIISLGIYEFFNYKQIGGKMAKILILILVLVGVYELAYFQHQYYVHQEKHQPWHREYAYKELVKELNMYYPKYEKIVISKSVGSPYIHILFNNKYDPLKYQALGSPRDLDYSGFDKYYFVPMDCALNGIKNYDPTKMLFIDSGNCKTPTKASLELKEIKWKDGTTAFRIMEYYATVSAKINSDE